MKTLQGEDRDPACDPETGCRLLTPEQAKILREKGTEPPFSHPLYHEHRPGTYLAADTGKPVFRSEQKFESGTGWPSFSAPITPEAVRTSEDTSHGMVRTEVLSTAGGHLGHLFPDGPEPTGLRYCINGAALVFVPDEQADKETSSAEV
jgi:peptide-methionine (R)-S-oxide reductase